MNPKSQKMFGRILSEDEVKTLNVELHGTLEERLKWIENYASSIAMGEIPVPEDNGGFRKIAHIAFIPRKSNESY